MKAVFDLIIRGIMFSLAYVYRGYECFAKGTEYVYESLLKPNISILLLGLKRVSDGARVAWAYGRNKINVIMEYSSSKPTNQLFIDSVKCLKNNVNKFKLGMAEENGIVRRRFWCFLVVCEWIILIVFITAIIDPPVQEAIPAAVRKLWNFHDVDGYVLLTLLLISLSLLTIGFLFKIIGVFKSVEDNKSEDMTFKIWPEAKCFCMGIFILACLLATYLLKDLLQIFFVLSFCFYFIPLLNIVGTNENFGIVDCLMAMLFEVGLIIYKAYPKCVPLVIAIAFIIAVGLNHKEGCTRCKEISPLENHSDDGPKINTIDLLPC